VLLHFFGITGAAVASLLGYTTIAVFTASAISRSTHLRLHQLMVPTPAVTKALMLRSISLLLGQHHRAPPGRHRRKQRRHRRGEKN
jgi:Na+-driven multidrug efflux pump